MLGHTFKNNGLITYNDDVYNSLFDINDYNYTLLITPKANTKFWRLGIRLSKTKDIEFYHPGDRYKEPEFNKFIDVHLGVGEWDGKLWTLPNRLNLAQYNLKGKEDHILKRSETYTGHKNITWNIKYTKDRKSLFLAYEADGVETFLDFYPLNSEYKYFKIFAWADESEFEIDCIVLETKISMDIEIKNSGRISDLTLKEISSINYIVGENRSGKSSLLAGIANLSSVSIHKDYPYHSYLKNQTSSAIKGNTYSQQIKIIGSISVLSPFFNPALNSNISRKFSNEDLYIIEEMGKDDDGEIISLGRYGFENSPKARLSITDAKTSAASGDKTLAYFKTELDKIKPIQYTLTIVIIDEPETHLNPKLHKEIHSLLEAKLKEAENLVFFVSTHSSYLIAFAAKSQSNTKVYCLADGKLIDSTAYWTDSEHRSKHLSKEANGFKPSECKLLVHDILGSTLNNYFPKILYCENSLKDLINSFVDRNQHIYERPLIIPSGNDIDSAASANTMSAIIEELSDHYKRGFNLLNPIAYAIVDKLNSYQNKEKGRIEKINSKHSGAVIILDESEIERSYPEELVESYLQSKSWHEWNKKTNYKEYLESLGINNQKIGMYKSEIANYVGANISLEAFMKQFSKIHNLLAI